MAVSGPASVTSYDWPTYGYDMQRTGYDPKETGLTASNASTLHQVWSADLGAPITAQPIVAAAITITGKVRDVMYVGTEKGVFYALDSSSGNVLWQRSLGTVTTTCYDVPNGVFGIGGSAALDRAHSVVYVAGEDGAVHGLDMITGAEHPGWPVTGVFSTPLEHVYGGINFNPASNRLYVTVAGECDNPPYHGTVALLNTNPPALVKPRFYPATPQNNGGGVWGPGGVSIDPASGNLYVGTGNSLGNPEYGYYSDQVVTLNPTLGVISHNYPNVSGFDVDFGSTPVLYKATGCGKQVAAKNKAGQIFIYDASAIWKGPTQTIQASDSADYNFNGDVAWDPTTNTLLSTNSAATPTYAQGILAFKEGANCRLTLAWQSTVGQDRTSFSPVTVAGGVAYFGTGLDNHVYAYNIATGAQLWGSGSGITGNVYAAPMVDTGRLYVPSWNHLMYAFAP